MSELVPIVEATGKLPPQPWMAWPETRAVVAALAADGAEVRFIGGCIRDSILKRPVADIDIATPDRPEQVVALLRRAGIQAVPTGIEHGTITAVLGDHHYEVTTLRVDVETDGRRARVAYTDDWIADAARRDFTINTFSSTPDGDLFDPFEALGDLAHGRVRFVGNPTQRIDEDVLRILRFFRFQAYYGRPPADAEALAACRLRAPSLDRLSGERVRNELLRILLADDPAEALLLMRGERVLERVLPEVGEGGRNIGRLRTLVWLETRALGEESIAPDAMRRLAAVLDTDAEGAARVADRLRLSNRQKDRLMGLAAPAADIAVGMDENALRRALHRLGAEAVRDLTLLAWSAERAVDPRQPAARSAAWRDLLAAAAAWRPVAFPLGGRDALALGLRPGPSVGAALKQVETWWEAGGCRAGRDACLARLRAVLSGD